MNLGSVQARILRALRDYDIYLKVSNYGTTRFGPDSDFRYKQGAEIRPTRDHFRFLKENNLIEPVDLGKNDRYYTYYDATERGIEVVENIDPPNFTPDSDPDMTAKFVKERLYNWHDREHGWIFYTELGLFNRVIDAYALGTWRPNRIVSYEIKVSRSDFFTELKQPEKREVALEWSNQFYFITPKGMVCDSEIPSDAGFKEVWENGYIQTVRDAPWTEVADVPLQLVAYFCSRHEEDILQDKVIR